MDISINAQTPIRREAPSPTNFFMNHKGDLTLAFSALVYLVSLSALMFTHWKASSEMAVSMAEAALIGGLCDYIALKMIFERRWYLPNSGVLPRNRVKLIDGIAATIENEWLTPQMIGRKLSDMDLVGRLGSYLQELKLSDVLGQAGLEQIISNAIEYLESPEKLDRLEAVLKRILPKTVTRIYAVMNRLGAQSIGVRIASNLRKRLPELQNDPELRATLESAIHEFGSQLHDPDSYANQLAQRFIDNMVRRTVEASRGQITADGQGEPGAPLRRSDQDSDRIEDPHAPRLDSRQRRNLRRVLRPAVRAVANPLAQRPRDRRPFPSGYVIVSASLVSADAGRATRARSGSAASD